MELKLEFKCRNYTDDPISEEKIEHTQEVLFVSDQPNTDADLYIYLENGTDRFFIDIPIDHCKLLHFVLEWKKN